MKFFNKISTTVSKNAHKLGFAIKKASPEILLVTGVVAIVGGTVAACIATDKAHNVMDTFKNDLDDIHADAEAEITNEKETRKETAAVYRHMVIGMAKVYAPAVAIETAGIVCILGSHKILKDRYLGLAAAYTALDKSFRAYRKNVVETFGSDVDKDLRTGAKMVKVTELKEDGTSEEKIVKAVKGPEEWSMYARVFEAGNIGWEKNPTYTLDNLKIIQRTCNDILDKKGRLTLNEVYTLLGYPETKYGMVVGWVKDPKDPLADNFVDFGLYDIHKEKVRDFINGYERCIILDFNVQGNIYDLGWEE